MAKRLAEAPFDILRARAKGVVSPRMLTFVVTFRCNAACKMCDSWKKDNQNEMSAAQIDRVLTGLPKLDAVRLTGGEPFLRSDLPEILESVTERLSPLSLHITTNGMCTDSIVSLCRHRDKTVPLDLLISIDGLEKTHNEIRGRKNAFARAFETIEHLAPEARRLNVNLSVNQTIANKQSAVEHTQLVEKLRPLGVPVQAVLAYEASATYSVDKHTDIAPERSGDISTYGSIDDETFRSLLEDTEKSARFLSWTRRLMKSYYWTGLQNRILNREGSPNPRCVALGAHMRLYPDGGVPVCQFNSKIIGNLTEKSFPEVWNGEKAANMRDWVSRCPGCWAECEVVPNAVYSGDILSHINPFGNR